MDISKLLTAKNAWNRFKSNHPKFAPFINAAAARGVPEGSVIELSIKYPNEQGSMKTNIKVTASDLELLELIKSLS